MIAKKIQAKSIRSKADYAFQLTDYMLRLNGKNSNEAVLYAGGMGFLGDDLRSMQAEMAALASESPRSANPIVHWILSWKEDEQPSARQVEQAVRILLDKLGLPEHQVIWAAHEETHNVHCHLAINRVHPDSGRVISPAKGFDIDAAHRAIAAIEWQQGWRPEENALYCIDPNGDEIRNSPRISSIRSIRSGARDAERWSGVISAERLAVEVAATLIRKSKSWNEVHEALGSQGMSYKRVGSGAVLELLGITVKASSAGRDCSLTQLLKRLGEYQPSPSGQLQNGSAVVHRAERKPSKWHEYEAARSKRKIELSRERKLLADQQKQQYALMIARHHQERSKQRALFVIYAANKNERINIRSFLAAKLASEKAWLKENQRREREAIKRKFPHIVDFESWLRTNGDDDSADEWRYRESIQAKFVGQPSDPSCLPDIRNFHAISSVAGVQYARSDLTGVQTASFIDTGSSIDMLNTSDRTAILAAMQLAQQKWGKFNVEGSPAFKRICIELAAEHGIKFSDELMQSETDLQKMRMSQAREFLRGTGAVNGLMRTLTRSDAEVFEFVATKLSSDGSIVFRERLEIEKREITRVATDSMIRKLQMISDWTEAGYFTKLNCKNKAKTGSDFDIEGCNSYAEKEWPKVDCETAYLKCHKHFASSLQARAVDLSRVDADIAVKLSAAGYETEEIERVILTSAKSVHQPDVQRDWQWYAKRVVAYASSPNILKKHLGVCGVPSDLQGSSDFIADRRSAKPA